MAKLIPPSSIFYFPHAPIVFSSPIAQKTTLDDPIILGRWWMDSIKYQIDNVEEVIRWLLKTPGDYEISFGYTGSDSTGYIRVYLNNSIAATVTVSPDTTGTATVTLRNVPGNSQVWIKAYNPNSTMIGFGRLLLKSSAKADYLVTNIATLLTARFSPAYTANSSASADGESPYIPPSRIISNKPLKVRGGWV